MSVCVEHVGQLAALGCGACGRPELHELEVDFDPGETPPTFLGVRVYRRKKTAAYLLARLDSRGVV